MDGRKKRIVKITSTFAALEAVFLHYGINGTCLYG